MENTNKDFEILKEQFNKLFNKQTELNSELLKLRIDLDKLESIQSSNITQNNEESNDVKNIENQTKINEIQNEFETTNYQNSKHQQYIEYTKNNFKINEKPKTNFEIKSNIEKFIGENLINKIGILFTIIGVAIGAKYAIDNQLISPLTRIILGYLIGIGLLIFAIKLKEKYNNFSSVLLSGALAIMYFITYFAYTLYHLIPQLFTFVLMVIFTIFTVIASLQYKKQIIALLGLVGAYAVPYLLSDGSGRVVVLFSYITLLNFGILFLSLKIKWDKLLYTAFGLTWLIFITWYSAKYNKSDINHFFISWSFITIYFAKFYLTLVIKLKDNLNNVIEIENIKYELFFPIMINSLIFYSIGYSILNTNQIGVHYLGLFTVVNALIHFGVTYYFYKHESQNKNIANVFLGLVLVFITIAIPIQFDGNWVTLFIALETLILFGFGRIKVVSVFEYFSYPLIIIGFFSLINDWQNNYNIYILNGNNEIVKNTLIPFFNVHLLSSLIFVTIYGCLLYIHYKYKDNLEILIKNNKYIKIETINHFLFSLPLLFILTLFISFYVEITYYWKILYEDSILVFSNGGEEVNKTNLNLLPFKDISLILYSILFFNIISFVNIKKIKNVNVANILVLIILTLNLIFLFIAFPSFNILSNNYIYNYNSEYFNNSIINILIRYIAYLFVVLSILIVNLNIKLKLVKEIFKNNIEIFFYFIIFVLLSNEIVLWYDYFKFEDAAKLAISIFWGIFSLFLIIIGIWKYKKHLRLSSILLFGITIIKLFFYDLTYLNTISKTILFITLGVILLVISFLYNKYKHLIVLDNKIEADNNSDKGENNV